MRIRAAAVALGLAFALAPLCNDAAATGFRLDDALSAPFVDDLTVSPGRDALAWTIHERGARNIAIWKDGTSRVITDSTADDGQELGGIAFVPSGTAVVYERGGIDQNGGDANPNPTAPIARVARKILLTPLAAHAATVELGSGRDPAISPAGDRVAWIDGDGQLAVASLASADSGVTWSATKPERPFTLRGTVQSFVFSPDGKRIALVNERGDHAYIALVSFGSPNVTFADPAFSNDAFPVWSPDSARVAFVRLPGDISTLSAYDDNPALFPPWSIVVADAATGAGRAIWQAPRGRGYDLNLPDGTRPLWWSSGGGLAFTWQRDGWLHLYALAPSGGTPRLLTPGAFDIENIARGASGNELHYTSNEGDLDARHVWRVSFDRPDRTPVSQGPSNQWSPVALSGGRYAYIDATARTPGTVTIVAAGSRTAVASALPAAFAGPSFVVPKAVVFTAPDGLTIHGQLFLAHDGKRKHPALIFVHGGPERQMLTTFHYFEAYSNLYELNQYLVSRGFDVLSVNYRSGIMYGRDFFVAPRRGWLGASEYQDVLAGAKVLARRSDVDARRIGIYGLSYGGYLTALALSRNSDVFAAGVDQAGVHDWPSILDHWYGRRVGSPSQRATALDASPVGHIATWRSPVLLDQGDDDRNVPFSQSVTLAGLLAARGVDVALRSVPDETHEYTVYAHELDRFQRTADFLAAHLGVP